MGRRAFSMLNAGGRRSAPRRSAGDDQDESIKTTVRWEDFRADIEAVTDTKPAERKSNAGRKPYDTILKLKIVVLQSLYNLSDEPTVYLVRDRLSFMRFLDLELEAVTSADRNIAQSDNRSWSPSQSVHPLTIN